MKPKQTKPADTPPTTAPKGRALEPHELLLHPEAQAGVRMVEWGKFAGDANLSVLVHEMFVATKEVKAGNLGMLERMLAAQAFSLDTMFTNLARQARLQDGLPQIQTLTGLAFKAQAQCRATIEALAEIKNPKAATFVRQANIAHQQQVNNGDAALPAPAPAQLAPPAPDALAGTWKQASEPVPAMRARENPESSKAE
ncbi:hypothetical protein B1A_05003 [mine drainage metagenome]|uniref:Uncharacterized protein n=2 Tax=mine drainage metagenome TaxID=410659 RepID=T1BK66_9ZZZZ